MLMTNLALEFEQRLDLAYEDPLRFLIWVDAHSSEIAAALRDGSGAIDHARMLGLCRRLIRMLRVEPTMEVVFVGSTNDIDDLREEIERVEQ